MPEVKLLKSFNCWNCGHSETVTGRAIKEQVDQGKIQQADLPYSLRKLPVPLIDPSQAKFTVPYMIVHYDICDNCGVEYVTRVETIDVPIKVVPVGKGQQPRGPGFGFGKELPPFFGTG